MAHRTQTQSKASPPAIQKALKGMNYPAGKDKLIQHAREHGAGGDVLSVLERLPEERWNSPANLMKAVGKIE